MSDTTHDKVILVNEHDQETGSCDKLQAHQQGLLHRAFSIFIFNKLNDKYYLLLQQRNADKYHCGGLWTNTCCSHPRLGESIKQAAQRRLHEEMGFNTELSPIGSFTYRAELDSGLVEHEYDHVLIGFYDGEIQPNPAEAQASRWIALDELEQELAQSPEQFTPWFSQALNIARKGLIPS